MTLDAAEWLFPEQFLFPYGLLSVAKCRLRFKEWKGVPPEDDYGGKCVVESEGQGVFAELAIVQMLRHEGFEAVWVDTFRNRVWRSMSEESALREHVRELYDEIAHANSGKRGGCWDVLAWKQREQFLSVESKQNAPRYKDSIQDTQKEWLEAAMSVGFAPSCFVVCEWDIERD